MYIRLHIRQEIRLILLYCHSRNEVHLTLARGDHMVDHSTVFDCLTSWFGVCGTSLMWFASYFMCVIAGQLNNPINTNHLDNLYQAAHKAGHSTDTALLSFKNEVHLTLARGDHMVDHSTVFDCLTSWFAVCGTALMWFAYYLSKQCQTIKIGSMFADVFELFFGAPKAL